MLTNADCTLYHKTYDSVSRLDRWTRKVISNVNWHAKRKVSVSENGLNGANTLVVQIPVQSVPDGLEIAVDDVIVKGILELDITQVKELSSYERYIVTAVSDNRYGSLYLHHWRIEGA